MQRRLRLLNGLFAFHCSTALFQPVESQVGSEIINYKINTEQKFHSKYFFLTLIAASWREKILIQLSVCDFSAGGLSAATAKTSQPGLFLFNPWKPLENYPPWKRTNSSIFPRWNDKQIDQHFSVAGELSRQRKKGSESDMRLTSKTIFFVYFLVSRFGNFFLSITR